jgi:hypothetical protein
MTAASSDPNELARDIERTRGQLGDTLQALAARANVKARAKEKAIEISGRVTTAARPWLRPALAAAAVSAAAWAVAIAYWWRDHHD